MSSGSADKSLTEAGPAGGADRPTELEDGQSQGTPEHGLLNNWYLKPEAGASSEQVKVLY